MATVLGQYFLNTTTPKKKANTLTENMKIQSREVEIALFENAHLKLSKKLVRGLSWITDCNLGGKIETG